jgi:hypothetical protein
MCFDEGGDEEIQLLNESGSSLEECSSNSDDSVHDEEFEKLIDDSLTNKENAKKGQLKITDLLNLNRK